MIHKFEAYVQLYRRFKISVSNSLLSYFAETSSKLMSLSCSQSRCFADHNRTSTLRFLPTVFNSSHYNPLIVTIAKAVDWALCLWQCDKLSTSSLVTIHIGHLFDLRFLHESKHYKIDNDLLRRRRLKMSLNCDILQTV